jgi:hypothetical protein
MTEEQIRGVIRDVLASRGLGPARSGGSVRPELEPSVRSELVEGRIANRHCSHVRLSMVAPTLPGSPCVIEPAVGCNQCGYCVSMGH